MAATGYTRTLKTLTKRTNAVTDVTIYSNAKPVELLVNGISNRDATDGVFVRKNATLKPGKNQIRATVVRNGQNLSDRCIWNLR